MSEPGVTFGGVTPNLIYEDAAEAIEWLVRVLGFEERSRYVDKDGIVRQAEMFVGRSEVWLAGRGKGFWNEHARGPAQYLTVWVDDVDAQCERVKRAGANPSPPVDQTWGVRNFHVTDPGGYHWGFNRRLPSGYRQVKSLEEGGLREIMKKSQPGS